MLRFDLRDYSDIADLRAAVFDHPELVRWGTAGTYRLTLALDSLDEELIEIRKLSTRLASELRALPANEANAAFRAHGTPLYFVVDADGVIRYEYTALDRLLVEAVSVAAR